MSSSVQLQVGDKAPDFSLPASNGETISLQDFLGKKRIVLYFYPKDNTSGCTKEACSSVTICRTLKQKILLF